MTVSKRYDILLNCISMEKTPLFALNFHRMYEKFSENSPCRRKTEKNFQKIKKLKRGVIFRETPVISGGLNKDRGD